MKLNFVESGNLRKIYIVKNLFSGMPEHMVAYPQIFGKEFAAGYALYKEFRKPSPGVGSRKEAEMELIKALFDGKDASIRLTELGKPNLIALLDSFDIPPMDRGGAFAIMEGLEECLSNYGNEFDSAMHVTFGFKLPETLNVLLCGGFGEEWVKGQMMVMDDPVLLGLTCCNGQNVKDAFAIAMHELLHALIYKHKAINYSAEKGAGAFEEALIRHFLPHGMFGTTLGIQDSNMEIGSAEAKRVYPEAAELTLLIKDYQKYLGKETIWEFLSKTKFAEFVNW